MKKINVKGAIAKEAFDVLNDNVITGNRKVINQISSAIKNRELEKVLSPYKLTSISDDMACKPHVIEIGTSRLVFEVPVTFQVLSVLSYHF